jgi:DivIVA domain-containing protein
MWFFALIVVVLIGAVAVVASGRWGAMSTAYDARPDMSVPARQALTSDDIETARFGVGLRGYRMDEVDTLLERVAREVAERDRRIADLERAVTPIMHGPEGAGFTSRHSYDADDFDDTGYQLPILVGGEFPPETTTPPHPEPTEPAPEAGQAAEFTTAQTAEPEIAHTDEPAIAHTDALAIAQTGEPGAAQAAESEAALTAEPETAQTGDPGAAQVAEAEGPPTATQSAGVEPQLVGEPERSGAAESEISLAAAQPVAEVGPQQVSEPERSATAESEVPQTEQAVAEVEAEPAPEAAFSQQPPRAEATQESQQAQASEQASPVGQPGEPQVDRGSVLEAPLPPVPPEPVLQQPEEEQAAWWPATGAVGERPAAAEQQAPRSGQLWADPGAAAAQPAKGQQEAQTAVPPANGQQEAQASLSEQQGGQVDEPAPRGRHSAAPDASAYQRPS